MGAFNAGEGGISTKGTINADGNISTNGIIKGLSLNVGSGLISTSGQIQCSKLIASDRNILTELTSLRTEVDKLNKLPGSMQLFGMQISSKDDDRLVTDPTGTTFNYDYVCCVQGVRSSWGRDEPHSIQSFCYRKNNLWYIKTKLDFVGGDISTGPIILVIPIRYFSKVEDPKVFGNLAL